MKMKPARKFQPHRSPNFIATSPRQITHICTQLHSKIITIRRCHIVNKIGISIRTDREMDASQVAFLQVIEEKWEAIQSCAISHSTTPDRRRKIARQ